MPIPKPLYDRLVWVKIIIAVLIPLVIGIDKIWSIPFGYQIIQTLTVVEAAIIGFLKMDSDEYLSDKEIVEKSKMGIDAKE